MKASLILLAGGKGLRMGSNLPKQFIEIDGKFMGRYALNPFLNHPMINQIVVVCDPLYRHFFNAIETCQVIKFADPGDERQLSLTNGLSEINGDDPMVIVHDAARPFLNENYIEPLISEAYLHGASVLGIKAVSTLKQATPDQFVCRTIDRSVVWEVQTPQLASKQTLLQGLNKAKKEGIAVTDESSVVELLNLPVKLVEGDSLNFKVTSQADLKLMQSVIKQSQKEYV
ncbi:MAG: 2-C-methyl-D-erythritol 4-phosphate cytidylyltransferase [Chlamydiae bacterium]|nr:2-C-methyl-D-erythritol 4-phosphate cytidylyltransferase [Chlamydiota bacterium]